MKIQLLIAVSERDYAEHLAKILASAYGDVFDVALCTSSDTLSGLLGSRRYDVGLFSPDTAPGVSPDRVRVPLLLGELAGDGDGAMPAIAKYRRVSAIVSDILELYAKTQGAGAGGSGSAAPITVVWSPYGGCGKTTVALAYAASRVLRGEKATYLDLEPFSSTEAFFPESGKSISTVFERLDASVELLVKSIEKRDSGSGICYFSRPDNYDDMNVLSADDTELLARRVAACTERLVIDTAGGYDEKQLRLLDMANEVLLVVDGSKVGRVKLSQFCEQNDLFKRIQKKTVLVANKGADTSCLPGTDAVALPWVNAKEPSLVYKTLSSGYFDAVEK